MLIAITGGIGCGKSFVCNYIRELGGHVMSADSINSELLERPSYISRIEKLFPDCVTDGAVDRVKLGKRIFYNSTDMRKLNELAHPIIIEEIKKRASEIEGTVFVEVPLLVESKSAEMFDKIWLVRAGRQLRVQRIVMRDLVSEEYAKRVMAAQANDEIRLKYATSVIVNEGNDEVLQAQVKRLYNQVMTGVE